MTHYRFSEEPPRNWDALCRRTSSVFGSVDWQQLLAASFGCRTVYAFDEAGGAAITLFRAGPFEVGYLGFPTGALVGEAGARWQIVSDFDKTARNARTVCLRVPVSAFAQRESIAAPSVATPETAITDLGSWDLMAVSKKLRRDIRKAGRSGLETSRSIDDSLGPALYGMYRGTVQRHGGSLRYNSRYFSGLVALAAGNPAVRIFTARMDSELVGFAVTVRNGDTSYYLHGGTVPHARQLSPSDLLLADAIADARDTGSTVFDLMSSPVDQPTLVRYKEKWGGETKPQRTYTVRLSPLYPVFNIAEKAYSLIA